VTYAQYVNFIITNLWHLSLFSNNSA